jgi:putative glutathione S-transferase
MGKLIEGVWRAVGYDTAKSGGRFVRAESTFRRFVTADGASGFKAEAGRYHLYVSLACPWAHRTLIVRKLKRLENAIGLSVVDWHMGDQGWRFSTRPGCIPDNVNGAEYLHQIYAKAEPRFTGRVTVPVLWDKERRTIVNNESADIIRMLNAAFDALGDASVDFYPRPLRAEIDRINALVYDTVNNGVYKCGFATAQAAYDEAVAALFATLDELDIRLGRQAYLVSDTLTEADWRLFTTLVRFDSVYHGHFKCNLRRIEDYANLANYLRALYQVPGVAETVDMHHIKHHYYESHQTVNPSGIVPAGPLLDFTRPHDRDRFLARRAREVIPG